MDRREILKASAVLLGYSVVGGASLAVLNGCKADTATDWKPSFLNTDQVSLLAEIGERIIPKTDTPGAKDALVHRYIDEAVKNNYTPKEQEMFINGLSTVDKMSTEKYGKKFIKITDKEKDAVLKDLSSKAKPLHLYGKMDLDKSAESMIFSALKDLVVTGFFTSEIGANTLDFNPVPGPFEGCIPLNQTAGTHYL